MIRKLKRTQKQQQQQQQQPIAPTQQTSAIVGQIKNTICPPISRPPLGNLNTKKKIGATEKQIGSTTDEAHWLNSIMMKPLSASFIIEFYAQAQDCAMAKIPRTGCPKTASPSIVIRKGKIKFLVFHLLMTMPWGTLRRYFVFTTALYRSIA